MIKVPRYSGSINEGLPIPRNFKNRKIETEPIDLIYENNGTEILIITFGGCGYDNHGSSQYGMANYLRKYDVSKILMRDQFNVWFLNGVRGVSTDVRSTVDSLSNYIDRSEASYIVTTGVSGGGFAAILFGMLLKVDKIVAINPQTLLKPGIECVAHGNLYKLKWCNPNEEMYRDLLNLEYGNDIDVNIIYGEDDPVDRFHSGRMYIYKNINLVNVPGNHSTVALDMRDNDKLEKALSISEFKRN